MTHSKYFQKNSLTKLLISGVYKIQHFLSFDLHFKNLTRVLLQCFLEIWVRSQLSQNFPKIIIFKILQKIFHLRFLATGNYMPKFNNKNTRTRCEICSKLTIKTPERSQWRRSGVFIVNFEHILHLVLVFLLLTLNR